MTDNQAIVDQNIYTFRNKQSEIDKPSFRPLQDKQNYLNSQVKTIKLQSNRFIRNQNENYSLFSKRQYLPIHRPSIVLKGKHILQKYNFKENSCRLIRHDFANLHIQSEIPKIQKGTKILKNFQKIRTETKLPIQINELNVCPQNVNFQNQLFHPQQTAQSNSCILNFTAVRPYLQNVDRKSFTLKKENNDFNHSFEEKISQSRGLQLFAKLYIRNRFQLMQKPKIKRSFCKPISQRSQEIKQNLDIRKISPIQKQKKKRVMNDRYEPKKVPLKNYCTTSNKDNNYKQFYELNGWQNVS